MAVVSGRVVVCRRRDSSFCRGVEPFIGTAMFAAAMVVLALVTFAAMLGFVALCDRV